DPTEPGYCTLNLRLRRPRGALGRRGCPGRQGDEPRVFVRGQLGPSPSESRAQREEATELHFRGDQFPPLLPEGSPSQQPRLPISLSPLERETINHCRQTDGVFQGRWCLSRTR